MTRMASGGPTPVLRAVTPSASVLLAPNPSPMTLEGTNTWLLRAGAAELDGYIVIDAGPPDEAHLARGRRRSARSS